MNCRTGIAALALTVLVSGCSSVSDSFVRHKGTLVSDKQMQAFVPGKASTKSVLASLGEPSKSRRKGDVTLWLYTYQQYNAVPLFVDRSRFQVSIFEFDDKGVLVRAWKKAVNGVDEE